MAQSDLVTLLGAFAAAVAVILGAIGTLWVKIHGYRAEVNGRMGELLELTRQSSRAEGRLETTDDAAARALTVPPPSSGTGAPLVGG
jgi:hypothetical protein